LFFFGLHVIFPRLVNVEAHPSRHDIQFNELSKEVQFYLISDGFEDVRETSMHVLWSLMWSPRFQQRIRNADGFESCCHRLKRDAQSAATHSSSNSNSYFSPISIFLLDKIISSLCSTVQPQMPLVGGSKVAARMPAHSASNSSRSTGSTLVASAPSHHPAASDTAADDDHLVLQSITRVAKAGLVREKVENPCENSAGAPAISSTIGDSLCVDLLRPYLAFLPSDESIVDIDDIKQDLLQCFTNINSANKAISAAYKRFGSLSLDALMACLYPRTSSLKRMHALLQQFIKTGKHLQHAHSRAVDSGHSLRCIEHVVNLCEDYLKFMIGAQKRLSDDVRAQAIHVDAVLLKRAQSAEAALHLVNRVRTFVHFDTTQFSALISSLECWRSWCHDCMRQDSVLVEAAKALRASSLWDLLQMLNIQEKSLETELGRYAHPSKRLRDAEDCPLSEDDSIAAVRDNDSSSILNTKILEFVKLTTAVREKLADLSTYISAVRGKSASVFVELNSFAALRQLRLMPLGLDRRLATVLAMTGLISPCENLIKGEIKFEDVGLQVYDCTISGLPFQMWQYAIPGCFSNDSCSAINIPKIIGQALIPHLVGSSFIVQPSRIFFQT
jgi:hypothetical protein